MKGKDAMKTAVWMPVVLLLAITGGIVQAAAEKSPTVLFQEALYQEETEGDLDKAIELYQQVLDEAAEVRHLAARSSYQLGLCHLKKGEKDDATEYFRQVVSKYPKQTSVVKKAQKQLDKIAPAALNPANLLPADIMQHLIQKHFQTGKRASEMGIASNTHIYGVDGFKKYSGGLIDVFNMGTDTWTEKRNIATFTPNNKNLKLYNEQYQEQTFEWEDVQLAHGRRSHLIWTPDHPVIPNEFRVLGYIYNNNPELPSTSNGYELRMQNHYGSEVLENFFLILPSTVKIVNQSHDITSHQRMGELDIYQFERHMKGEDNIVTVTLDFIDLTTSNSPIVVKTSPENFTNNVSPETTEITVTFDKEMVPHSYAWCRNQHPYPETSGNPLFSNGNFSCTLSVVLQPGRYYRIGINTPPYQSFKSINGDPAHHYVLVFATADVNGKPTKIPPSLIEEARTINLRFVSPEELVAMVEKAVLTISTCAEGDPRIKTVMDPLKSLDDTAVAKALAEHLDSDENTIRRSAIYMLWRCELSNIEPAVAKLEKLCSHTEDLTRGMAALALGQNKIASSFETLKKMTIEDSSGYARRCGAYALGLMGDPKAKPILEKAINDSDKMVQDNAKAALRMFELNPSATAANLAEADKQEAENLVAEGWKLWGQRKLAEAEDKFKQAVRSDTENDGAYQGLGWAQLNQGKKKNAEVSFKKCVKLNPENSAALNGLGWIEHGQGNIDKAILWWEKAIKSSNGTATASLSGLTQVYMERKEYDKAVKYYQMWLKAEPNNQDAKEGLEKAGNMMK